MMEDVMIRLAKFRAEVEAGGIVERNDIINNALRLDDDLSEQTSSLHRHGQFDTTAAHDADTLLPGDHRAYPDMWYTYIGNYSRTCRLILHRIIQGELEREDAFRSSGKSQNLRSQSRLKSQELIGNICASIPQYCDNMRQSPSHYVNDDDVPRIAGAYFVLWPAMTAGHLTESTELRDRIIDQCRSIGQMTGIRRANAIASVLKRKESIFHTRQPITNTSQSGDGAGLPNRRWLEDGQERWCPQ
jgi:hypothetical protein